LLEFYYKSDDLDDPIMNDDHILYMKITNVKELKRIKFLALKINTLLSDFFDKTGILLVDFKLEFGRYKNKILLADEISPDSCRLWDKKFKKSYDKDLFRENKGDLIKAYKKILKGLDRI
jgi:phosphoribosylaminoimidazole-succinocarboxamide synthase